MAIYPAKYDIFLYELMSFSFRFVKRHMSKKNLEQYKNPTYCMSHISHIYMSRKAETQMRIDTYEVNFAIV